MITLVKNTMKILKKGDVRRREKLKQKLAIALKYGYVLDIKLYKKFRKDMK